MIGACDLHQRLAACVAVQDPDIERKMLERMKANEEGKSMHETKLAIVLREPRELCTTLESS